MNITVQLTAAEFEATRDIICELTEKGVIKFENGSKFWANDQVYTSLCNDVDGGHAIHIDVDPSSFMNIARVISRNVPGVKLLVAQAKSLLEQYIKLVTTIIDVGNNISKEIKDCINKKH